MFSKKGLTLTIGGQSMNFFRDKELAQRFVCDEVPEREQFWYLLVLSLLYCLLTSMTLNNLFYEPLNFWDYVMDGLIVIATILGVFWMYQINAKGDGRDFIARYTCLSFPISIRTLLIFIILIVGLLTLEVFIDQIEIAEEGGSPYFVAIIVLCYLYFYLRMAAALRIASATKE